MRGFVLFCPDMLLSMMQLLAVRYHNYDITLNMASLTLGVVSHISVLQNTQGKRTKLYVRGHEQCSIYASLLHVAYSISHMASKT